MLFSYFAHHVEFDCLRATLVVTLDGFSECDNCVEAKYIHVTRQQHLSRLPVTISFLCDGVFRDAVVDHGPTLSKLLLVMRGHLARDCEPRVRAIDRLTQQTPPPARIRQLVTLVMSLPVVHHVNDEVQIRMLLMYGEGGGKNPRRHRHYENVPD